MPGKRANVKNEKQYEALKDNGMFKHRGWGSGSARLPGGALETQRGGTGKVSPQLTALGLLGRG